MLATQPHALTVRNACLLREDDDEALDASKSDALCHIVDALLWKKKKFLYDRGFNAIFGLPEGDQSGDFDRTSKR